MRRQMTAVVVLLCLVVLVLPTVLGRVFGSPAAQQPARLDGSDSLSIKVFFPEDQRVVEMPLGEYLKGVVLAEMPAEFENEALKAQFVVARTYAVRRMGQGSGGCPLKPAADICADTATGQDYMSLAEAEKKLGRFAAKSYWNRLGKVQQETEGLVLRYQGELIDPLYHSVSGRVTENAENYYPQSVPYLRSVDDHWGAYAPKLQVTVTLPLSDFLARLSNVRGGVAEAAVSAITRQGGSPVEVIARTDTGRVARVRVAGVEFTGREFRELLGLRSTDFQVRVENGAVVVTTFGYGHGVGMSQYGANGMAKAGKTYTEILQHYYRGVTVSQVFTE